MNSTLNFTQIMKKVTCALPATPATIQNSDRNLAWFKQLTVQTSRKKESNSMFADIAYQKNQSSYIGVFRKNFIIWDDKK